MDKKQGVLLLLLLLLLFGFGDLFCLAVLGIESRASHILGKLSNHSATHSVLVVF
jgi:hypothetical protein